MPKNPSKPRPAGSLKEAFTDLLMLCGGAARAAAVVRVQPAQLTRYSDPDLPQVHAPVDVIQALETLAGDPLVTRYLAHSHGAALVPVSGEDKDLFAELAADAAKGSGGLQAQLFASLEDGTIDKAEAALVKALSHQQMGRLEKLYKKADAILQEDRPAGGNLPGGAP